MEQRYKKMKYKNKTIKNKLIKESLAEKEESSNLSTDSKVSLNMQCPIASPEIAIQIYATFWKEERDMSLFPI